MLTSEDGTCNKSIPPGSDFQEVPQDTLAVENAARSIKSIPAAAVASPQFRHRILVVDDEPSVREMAQHVLESEGYEVLTANDGLGALIALGRSLPDLIISDLNMPSMSGFELLAIVRKRFPHIATIAMSGDYIAGEK